MENDSDEDVWKILIADDDKDVHEATLFILEGFRVFNRGLGFFHAYSATETIEILRENEDIAVILLDVVMEQEDAGLNAVEIIRNELERTDVRIILRTGQPGQVPEWETILKYDVNDYKSKAELTKTKLITSVVTALRSWKQLRRLKENRLGFDKILESGDLLFAEEGLLYFIEGILRQAAVILDIQPEGILCISVDRDKKVIAAAGKYQNMINRSIFDIGENGIIYSVLTAIDMEHTVFKEDSLSLYISDFTSKAFVIYVASSKPLDGEKRLLVKQVCTSLSLYSGKIRQMSTLKSQAWMDNLLPIPNLNALMEKTEILMKRSDKEEDLLILLDIVSFHKINNLFGFDYGNDVLRSFSHFMRERFDQSVFMARLSSDIFCLLGKRSHFSQESMNKITHIEIDMAQGTRELALAVGGTVIRKGSTPPDELNKARRALKQAKDKGSFVLCEPLSIEDLDPIDENSLSFLLDAPFSDFCWLKYKTGEKGIEVQPFIYRADGEFVPPGSYLSLLEAAGRASSWRKWVIEKARNGVSQLESEGGGSSRIMVRLPQAMGNSIREGDDLIFGEIQDDESGYSDLF
jgi:diguanylate cyclase